MNDIKLSIIIAFYNTEISLFKRNLDSILSQRIPENVEIIIADDGSELSKRDVAIELLKNNKQVSFISNEHRGVSATRNFGADYATGEYICFVDADDTVSNRFIEKALGYISKYKADAIYGTIQFIPDHGWYVQSSGIVEEFHGEDILKIKEALYGVRGREKNYTIIGSACGRLYNRTLFQQIKFKENIRFSEDQIFNREFLNKAQTIVVVPDPWYQYYSNASSVTHNVQIEEIFKKHKSYWEEFLNLNAKENDTCRSRLRVRALGHLYSYIGRYICISDIDWNSKYQLIQEAAAHPLMKDAADNLQYSDDQLSLAEKIILFLVKNKMYLLLYALVKIKNNEHW